MMLFDSTPDGWSETTLGEICSSAGGSIQTGPFGSQLHASDYVSEGIPSIMPANIIGGRVREDGIARITESDAQRLSKYLVQEGDIVYSRRGDVEKCALITESESGWLCGTGCLRVRLGKDVVDPLFAFHFLSHPESKAWISRHAVGATMPNLNTGILSDVPFLLPSSMEQKAIAHILGALDDKIELNQKMNQTLEEIAKAIFKSWFVDFEPVRAKAEGRPTGLPPEISDLFPDELVGSEIGEIPKGWDVVELQEYITVKRGGSPRPIHDFMSDTGLPWVKISDASASDTRWIPSTKGFIKKEGLKKTVLLRENDLILSNSATPGIPRFLNLDACIHDGWLYFPEKKQFTDQYLYQLFLEIRPHLLNLGSGTVFTNLKTDILKQYRTVLPSAEIMTIFEDIALAIHQRCKLVLDETTTLSELRDTLLPKLISGELRIPDAEKFLEEAGL